MPGLFRSFLNYYNSKDDDKPKNDKTDDPIAAQKEKEKKKEKEKSEEPKAETEEEKKKNEGIMMIYIFVIFGLFLVGYLIWKYILSEYRRITITESINAFGSKFYSAFISVYTLTSFSFISKLATILAVFCFFSILINMFIPAIMQSLENKEGFTDEKTETETCPKGGETFFEFWNKHFLVRWSVDENASKRAKFVIYSIEAWYIFLFLVCMRRDLAS